MSNNSQKANLGSCALCNVPCPNSCGACKKVSYCSKAHQQEHWKKSHKNNCFPLVLQTSEILGRHLVTTRDIRQGEIILKETPIFSGPHVASNLEKGLPICLSCFRIVQTDYKCAACKWPLCSVSCEKDYQHSEFECKVFSKNKIDPVTCIYFDDEYFDVYEAVTVLRGVLLKQIDTPSWSKILDLQSHSEERTRTGLGKKLREFSIHFVREICQQKHIEEEVINHVLGTIGVNAFVSDDGVSQARLYRNGTYLCHIASMPAHNCVPNTSWLIQLNSDFHLRASVPIKCGESVTFLYTESTKGTRDRQIKLKESKYFVCTCPRCLDPTELGSYFSAVKCQGCENGYLLPLKPLDSTFSDWNCDKCCCKKSWDFVSSAVTRVKKDLELVGQQDNFTNVDKLLNILDKHSGKTLHSNNYKIHDIENDVLQRISYLLFQESGKNNKRPKNCIKWAERLVQLSRKCLAISDIIWPGYNRHRGRILYFLQQGLTLQLLERCKSTKAECTKKEDLKEILLIRMQVLDILKIEPEGREESYIAKAMEHDSNEIKILKTMLLK